MQLKLLWDAVYHAPVSVIITNHEGMIQFVNPRFESMTGYSFMETVGKNPKLLKSGKHDQIFYTGLWDTLISGNDWTGEIQNKRKDGQYFWSEVSISPIKDHQGKIQYFIAIQNEITHRKLAEAELEKSNLLFQTLAQVSPVGIFRTRADGLITYVNPRWCELTGISFEDSMGEGWMNAIHPDDRKTVFNSLKEVKSLHVEFRFLKPDGGVVWVIQDAVPEIKEGDIIGYVGTVTDITNRKSFEKELFESQLKYKNLVEDINDVLFEIDPSGILKYLSPVINNITGFSPDVFIGKPFIEMIHPDEHDLLHQRINQMKQQIELAPIECRLRKSDGTYVWVRSFSKPIVVNGKVNGIRGLIIDISIQKAAREELINAKNRAEASDRLKSAFLNNISHEIRTPLNGILGFAPLVLDRQVSFEEKHHYLNILNQSGERLLQTITDFMDISIITSGNFELHPRQINPGEILKNLFDTYKVYSGQRKIEFVDEISPDSFHVEMNTDAVVLEKICRHLLDNAFKFTPSGSVHLRTEVNADIFNCYVTDTGIGISKHMISSIFDTFMQEDVSINRGYEGSGLGLAIVKGLVSLLGGSISVRSEKGKGSTFFFSLPCKVTKAKPKLEKTVTLSEDKPQTVLIVEDDKANYIFFQVVLRSGFTTLHAENGLIAVEMVKKNPSIGMVLMDVKLPLMNGYEATREIKRLKPALPVIAVTAYAQLQDEVKCLEAGCDDYLAKPVAKETLLSYLEKYGIIARNGYVK